MAPIATSGAPGMANGGMGQMMDEMIGPTAGGCVGGECGPGGAQLPIYPSLMTMPTLTPEKRAEIDTLAARQLNDGAALLATSYEGLSLATRSNDYAAMQESVGLMRKALGQVGAGIAARRVLAEGKAPRNLALDWFKREMNLASPISRDEPRTVLGVRPLHLVTMGVLVSFALAMVAIYFANMRRAAALFRRIDPDSGSPPPAPAPPPAAPTSPAISDAGAAPATDGLPGGPSAMSDTVARSAPPATANWRGRLRVGNIAVETATVKTFRLLSPSGDRDLPFTFFPGQFLNVTFAIGGARMHRSYSISSSPKQRGYVEVTVRREPRGAVSRHLHDLVRVGDLIEAGGPVGRFTFSGTEADSVVLIAGGVGITPMMSIARYLTDIAWGGDIFLIYACRAPDDFIFARDVKLLNAANPKLHATVTMFRVDGTDWRGARGNVTLELLARAVPNIASRRIHLCGPLPMMDATKAILFELGVPPEQVKTELFGAAKPRPAPSGTSAKPASAATGPLVTFRKSGKSANIRIDQTILELSEQLAIHIDFSCRIGTCGVCKTRMTSGEVEMAVDDALDPADRAAGMILACQARPRGPVTVEA